MKPAAVASILAVLLGGCAATGTRFADYAVAAAPPAAEWSRVIVFRGGDSPQYSARSASLAVDGVFAANLRLNGFVGLDVARGAHRIAVDMWDAPGRCEVVLDAAPGDVAYFEVSPRVESLAAGTPGTLMPITGPAALVAATATMLGGMAVESAGTPCGGAFAIRPVDAATALAKLPEMRSSAR